MLDASISYEGGIWKLSDSVRRRNNSRRSERMKYKLGILLSGLLLIGNLCACGESASVDGSNSETSVKQTVENEKKEESEEEKKFDESSDLSYPEDLAYLYTEDCFGYSIRLLPYYNIAMGYGYVSYEGEMNCSEVIYVTQYSGEVGNEEQLERIDMSKYGDSTDIFDLLIWNIDHELYAGMGENLIDYTVEIVETKEINGVEMTKFEGEIKTYFKYTDEELTYPIVAYGIKSSKTPILVSCIDRTEDSSSHEIWVDKIDDVVSTFKDGE